MIWGLGELLGLVKTIFCGPVLGFYRVSSREFLESPIGNFFWWSHLCTFLLRVVCAWGEGGGVGSGKWDLV